MEKVYILDTTLRDGAQSPLVSFTLDERVELAKALAALNVDVIDCGYPALNAEEEEAVRRVVDEIEGPVLSVLAKARESEVEKAISLLQGKKGRVHIPIPTSEIRLAFLAGVSKEEQIKIALDLIKRVKGAGLEVEVTLEDSFRADRGYLKEVARAVSEGGADVLNISDTVGIATPSMVAELTSHLKEIVPENVILSIHCHDDLGMATANTFAALENGARQAHLTIAGVGTRAGNAALEEVVVALKLHEERLCLYTDVELSRLYKTARIFSKITGYVIPPHKAIVGDTVFAHKVEYMRLAVVSEPRTYEIIDSDMIGYPKKRIVLSKRSGKFMFREKVEELGYQLTEEQLEKAFEKFKEIAEKKSEVYDSDIIAIIEDVLLDKGKRVELISYSVKTGSDEEPEAYVKLEIDGEIVESKAKGDGPVDAAFRAIDEAVGLTGRLIDYRINAVSSGKDALGEVFLRVLFKGKEFTGRGIGTDILHASIEAYINAVNKAY
ncbi:2-isopropylmalate synthase [Thermosulfidibacter takaii ABI70S6]|uniref:2-isopropylmalate synthase n=1 Tax=Thermosulfidibacter takaii (strain DSM 17441 / JCM 13301 / NBRC 103674 / ABI70S6) TaxID=1298851 RepID=A0A0S3QVB4_THET7|nr:2-isopropylmalate synthase [Thermosulfidibacter takaii]BAT72272.1 2-isopropylmalate synthase [Thermosulfidibacter takaii ABI70S6]